MEGATSKATSSHPSSTKASKPSPSLPGILSLGDHSLGLGWSQSSQISYTPTEEHPTKYLTGSLQSHQGHKKQGKIEKSSWTKGGHKDRTLKCLNYHISNLDRILNRKRALGKN